MLQNENVEKSEKIGINLEIPQIISKEINQNNFNELKHIPPKYDIFGRLKKVKFQPGEEKTNILSQKEIIKLPWDSDSKSYNQVNSNQRPKTRTELLSSRRKEKLPDISYDLDKDGYVGGRDYVLAKRFDKDHDGKLDEIEKKAAYEAIHDNYEDQFIWNLENQGANRGYRIMQKRGVVVDAEDFGAIKSTYPSHPLSLVQPKHSSFKSLQDDRKETTKKEIEEKIHRWQTANPSILIAEPILLAPRDKKALTKNQKKEAEHRQARLNCGLKEFEDEINQGPNPPSLDYVAFPKHKTISDLREEAKKENIERNKLLAHKQHINEVQRLQERENEILEKLHGDGQPRTTIRKIQTARKKENLEFNIKNFSKQTIGVHGHELPKFAENNPEWWKTKEGYIENPEINSACVLREKIKYWKKTEELLINEHEDKIATPDQFKKIKVLREKKDDLIIKVNNLNHFEGFDPDNPNPIDIEELKKNHIYKWTTLVHQFAPQKFKKGRFFDSITEEMKKAVYSSNQEQAANYESAYMKL
jgi:hypothetical protein